MDDTVLFHSLVVGILIYISFLLTCCFRELCELSARLRKQFRQDW